MNDSPTLRLLLVASGIGIGQAVFITFLPDTRPSTAYVCGVLVGILVGALMANLERRSRR